MNRKDSGTGQYLLSELPESLNSIIIHHALIGRVHCTAIIPLSYHIKQIENTCNENLSKLSSCF